MNDFVSKMERVTKNLNYMVGMDAPESDVKAYMDSENVTAANLRQYGAILNSQEPTKPNALESIGRGFTDIASGVGQLTGAEGAARDVLNAFPGGNAIGSESQLTEAQASEQNKLDNQLYTQNKPGFDGWRIAGQAAATAPLAAIPGGQSGLLARTASGAGAGGLAGLLTYADSADERAYNTVSGLIGGGAFGAVSKPLATAGGKALGALGRGVDAVKKMMPAYQSALDDAVTRTAQRAGVGSLDDSAMARVRSSATEWMDAGMPDDGAALARKEAAAQFGLIGDAAPTRGQLLKETAPDAFSDELNVSKLDGGGALASRFNNQMAQIRKYVNGLERNTDMQPEDVGELVGKAVRKRSEEMQSIVREAYGEVDKLAGGLDLPAESLSGRTQQILADFEDAIPSQVKRRIKQLTDGERPFTFDEFEKLDKLITDNIDPMSKPNMKGMAELKSSIMGVLDDAEGYVAPEVRAAYQNAKKVAKERFDALGSAKSLTGKLSMGIIEPEDAAKKLRTGKLSDLRKLKELLSENEWGQAAQSVLNDIADAATPSGQFKQSSYNNAIKKLGKRRLEVLFGKSKASELMRFGEVTEGLLAYPNHHTVNTSNSAPELAKTARGLLGMVSGNNGVLGLLGDAAQSGAARKANQAAADAALGVLYQPKAIPNVLEPLDPLRQALTPGAGLLIGNTQ